MPDLSMTTSSTKHERRAFGTRVAPELLERLEDVRYRCSKAKRRKVTITALIEQALIEFLERSESAAR